MSVNVLFVCVLAARSRSELWPLCVCVFGTGSLLLLLLSRLSTLSWCCHHTASALRLLFGTFLGELYLRCVVRCASVLARVCLLFWKTFAPAKWTEATTVRSVDTVEKKSASVREQPF